MVVSQLILQVAAAEEYKAPFIVLCSFVSIIIYSLFFAVVAFMFMFAFAIVFFFMFEFWRSLFWLVLLRKRHIIPKVDYLEALCKKNQNFQPPQQFRWNVNELIWSWKIKVDANIF